MRLNRLTAIGLATLGIAAVGCGKKKSADATTTPPPAGSASGVAADSEQSTSVVGAQMDESTTAISAGDSSSNGAAGAAFTDDGEGFGPHLLADTSISRQRNCTADATSKAATVTIQFSGTGTQNVGKAVMQEQAGGTETRVWTNSNNSVVCTKDNKYAKVAWKSATAVGTASGYNGLSLADTTTRTKTVTATVTKKDGTTKTRTAVSNENGTRNVAWTAGTTAGTTTKTITLDVKKTFNLTKFDGTTADLGGEHTVVAATPLVVTTTRDATGVPTQHVIASGTMAINKTGSFYVTNAFSGVTYVLSGTDPCTPTAGKITTNVFKSNSAADMATPLQTLTIDFSTNPPTVTGGDASAQDNMVNNINHKCDLKDPE